MGSPLWLLRAVLALSMTGLSISASAADAIVSSSATALQTSAASSANASSDISSTAATSLMSVPALATDTATRTKPTMKLSVSVSGRRIHDQFVKSNTAGPGLELQAEHKFNKKIFGTLVVGTLLNTGSASSLYTTEGQPSSFVYMNEASFTYQPLEAITLKGGVLETKFSTNQSLFRASGFPGVSEGVKFGGSRLNLILQATQTLPSASGISKNYVDTDVQPYLFLNTIGANAGEKDDLLSASVSGTHYLFGDLPANAAQDSRFVGNSVVGVGASAARFQYQYQGFEVATTLRSRLSRSFAMELKTSGIRNQEAPNGQNLGYNATFVPVIDVGNVELKPEVGYFHNESDTLPATYTSTGLGSNNRHGWLAGIKAKFKSENVTLSSRWVEANKIDKSNPYTADRTIFTVGLETSYDIL